MACLYFYYWYRLVCVCFSICKLPHSTHFTDSLVTAVLISVLHFDNHKWLLYKIKILNNLLYGNYNLHSS